MEEEYEGPERRKRTESDTMSMLIGKLQNMTYILESVKEQQESFREESKAITLSEFAKLDNKIDKTNSALNSRIDFISVDVENLKERGTQAIRSLNENNSKDHTILDVRHRNFRKYIVDEISLLKTEDQKIKARVLELEQAPVKKAASLWNTSKGKVIAAVVASTGAILGIIGTAIYNFIKGIL